MHTSRPRTLPFALVLAVAALTVAMSGCGVLYKQPIYQGNLIDKSAADQLRTGMSREEVQALLGTPSIADPFHHDRWDYVASERTGRIGHTAIKDLTLWFQGNTLSKWEGTYFPDEDRALVQEMRKFGNLPRDKDKKKQH